MRFVHPALLLLLPVVLFLAWLRYRRLPADALPWSSALLLAAQPCSSAMRLRRLRPVLFVLAGCFLVVALAGPLISMPAPADTRRGIDLMVVLDASASMKTGDFRAPDGTFHSRLSGAGQVVTTFVRQRPDDRIGLVVFAGEPRLLAPPTTDHDFLLDHLDALRAGMLPDGTAIGDAVAAAANRLLTDDGASRVIILVTDGSHNAGFIQPLEAARAARALGITVYAVGLGGQGVGNQQVATYWGDTRNQTVQPSFDEQLLRGLAAAGGGRYFAVADMRSLEQVYAAIDRLERTAIEAPPELVGRLFSWPFVLIAGLFLTGEHLLDTWVAGRLAA